MFAVYSTAHDTLPMSTLPGTHWGVNVVQVEGVAVHLPLVLSDLCGTSQGVLQWCTAIERAHMYVTHVLHTFPLLYCVRQRGQHCTIGTEQARHGAPYATPQSERLVGLYNSSTSGKGLRVDLCGVDCECGHAAEGTGTAVGIRNVCIGCTHVVFDRSISLDSSDRFDCKAVAVCHPQIRS